MDSQSVIVAVWLGVALLAIICSQLVLWRTRHTLSKLRQDPRVPDGQLVPVARAEVAHAVVARSEVASAAVAR